LFYILSKTLDLLVAPLTWVIVLVLAGAWGAHRRRSKLALRAPLAALAVLFAFSCEPVANGIVLALESSAATTMSASETYDVVVVLGGIATVDPTSLAPDFSEGVDRILAGYDVIRHDRARYILVTSDAEEAPALAKQLAEWGVAPDRIVIDDRSRNTRDNATRSADIIRERGWSRVLLVTSALHMPRAQGCFRAAGLVFDTLAVDRLARDPRRAMELAPRADALSLSTAGIREAVGRLVYRAMGYAR